MALLLSPLVMGFGSFPEPQPVHPVCTGDILCAAGGTFDGAGEAEVATDGWQRHGQAFVHPTVTCAQIVEALNVGTSGLPSAESVSTCADAGYSWSAECCGVTPPPAGNSTAGNSTAGLCDTAQQLCRDSVERAS